MSLNRGIKTFFIVLLLAVFSIKSVLAYNPEAVQMYNDAVDLSKNGNFQESILLFKKAIAIDPSFTDAYYNLASIYEYLGNSSLALANFEAILKKNPNDSESAYKAAAICYKMKSYAKAQSYLHLISAADSNYSEAQALNKKIQLEVNKVNQAKVAQAQHASLATQTTSVQKPVTSSLSVSKPVTTVTRPSEVEFTKTILRDFSGPTGIAKDSRGNLYIANYTANNIVAIAPDGSRSIIARSPDINGPVGLAVDAYNNVYVANYVSNEVIKITSDGKSIPILKGVNKPYYLYIDKAGILYVSEQGSNTIIKVKVI